MPFKLSKPTRWRRHLLVMVLLLCLVPFLFRKVSPVGAPIALSSVLHSLELPRYSAERTPQEIIADILSFYAPTLSTSVVVDVGANKGYPATRLALKAGVGMVISVEPDNRNFEPLKNLAVPVGWTVFRPIRGACSDQVGKFEMAFHRDRDDFTCVGCLNKTAEHVTTEEVNVTTVDTVVADDMQKVLLIKTDTQGHEVNVLRGAKETLKSAKFVIVEFDPKLLRTKENAGNVFAELSSFRCSHLKFAPTEEGQQHIEFGAWASDDWERFYDFVKGTGKYTDLFCLKKE